MIQFSDDWKGPGFGLLTKARGFDKWAHLAGSAAGMLICLGFMRYICKTPDWFIYTIGMWISTAIVFGIGLGIEIKQGYRKWVFEDGTRDPERVSLKYWDSDGFSFLDLLADALGILLVWGVIM